tara:strand:- start:951 stop:1991 length:1041 start_codon:yes stop_codon:yes gene_type:complete
MDPNSKTSINSPEIVCFGEALIDRLGSLGEDPFVDPLVQDYLGGAPANVACGLARLGGEVAFVGKLGDDDIGNKFQNKMLQRGINTSCLQIDTELPSRVVLVRRDLFGQRFFDGFAGNKGLGFADEFVSSDLISQNWSSISQEAKWLVVGTIPLAFKQSSESLWWCINNARLQGIQIAVDVNWRSVFWNTKANSDLGPSKAEKELIMPLLEISSLIKLSKEEATWFFNTNDPELISNSLINKPDIVITDGPNTIFWLFDGSFGQTKTFSSISVIDATGAGDAFTAGLLFKLLRKPKTGENSVKELNKIVLFAAACGSIVCTAPGAIDSQPNYQEVEDFLSKNGGYS